MQRMWRQMVAAAAGVLVVAGMASAQYPPPNPLPPVRAVPVPAQAGSPVVPASGAAYVKGTGGCTNCGNTPAIPYAQYGAGQANGCGSFKSDLGFMFGSCKSFFNPCGPLPCEGTGRFGHKKGHGCPTHPFGAPYGTGYNGCQYDSWLNH